MRAAETHQTDFNNFIILRILISEMNLQEHIWTPDWCSGGKELLSQTDSMQVKDALLF